MMGRKHREQASLFYVFRLDDMIPKGHLLRRINVFVTSVLGDLHEQLGPFYSDIGRPSIDPELLIRMLIRRTQAVITARRPMNSIGLRSSSESVRWLSILRHSKLKRRLMAMPRMTTRVVDPRANDSAVMSASHPR